MRVPGFLICVLPFLFAPVSAMVVETSDTISISDGSVISISEISEAISSGGEASNVESSETISISEISEAISSGGEASNVESSETISLSELSEAISTGETSETGSSDVMCAEGTQMMDITLNLNDSYMFSTKGDMYDKGVNCTATYTLGPDCMGSIVNCTTFHIVAEQLCRSGDILTITDEDSPKKFCRKRKPDEYMPKGNFTMNFASILRDEDTASGFTCEVTCPEREPQDCMMSNWGKWSECKGGFQFRDRKVWVEPFFGGEECGETTEIQMCGSEFACACELSWQYVQVDCLQSEWTEWSACPCGGGDQSRTRTVVVPPQNGGSDCGALEESESCDGVPCACEEGWTMFDGDGKCYFYFGDDFELEYPGMEYQCRQYGATTLLSITSEEKSEFIKALASETYKIYLGVIYDKDSQTHSWVDGSPWSYTRWGTGEPDDTYGECTVMVTDDNEWFMDDCTTTRGFVCVKDPQ